MGPVIPSFFSVFPFGMAMSVLSHLVAAGSGLGQLMVLSVSVCTDQCTFLLKACSLLLSTFYWLFISIVAVTNYHKLSSLKEHSFINLQFWRSEVQNGSYWVKAKCWETCVQSEGFREASVSFTSPASRGCPRPLAHALLSCQHITLTSVSEVIPLLSLTLLAPSYEDPCDYIGPSQIFQDNLLN